MYKFFKDYSYTAGLAALIIYDGNILGGFVIGCLTIILIEWYKHG